MKRSMSRCVVLCVLVLLGGVVLNCAQEPEYVGTEAGNAEQIASISGIAFKGGSPASEAAILYASSDSCTQIAECAQSAMTDTFGFYHIDSLKEGEWIIQVSDDSNGVLSTVEVLEGRDNQMDTVSLLPLGTVSGILSGSAQGFSIKNSFAQPSIDSVYGTFTIENIPQGEYQLVDMRGDTILDVTVDGPQAQFLGYLNISDKIVEKVEGYNFCENLSLPGYFIPQFIVALENGIEDTSVDEEIECFGANLAEGGQYVFTLINPTGISIEENWVLNISYSASESITFKVIDINDRVLVIELPSTIGSDDSVISAFPITGTPDFDLNQIKILQFVSNRNNLEFKVDWFKLSNE
ncbi:MAG: hypothetical protein OCC49_06190 [Fibrobacterales bacterium]